MVLLDGRIWRFIGFSRQVLDYSFSVKWVGLFSIALVGLHTLTDLWTFLGDLKLSSRSQLIHFATRVLFLVILPITVYMLTFAIHFGILSHTGPGDAQMSSLFQAGLEGNNFKANPLGIFI